MYDFYAEIRDEKGLKDADIVKTTGISSSTLSEWKSKKHTPSVEKLKKIADALDVSISAIVYGKPDPNYCTAEETELLRVFRTLNRSGRATLASLMKTIAATPEYQNINTKKLSGSEIA